MVCLCGPNSPRKPFSRSACLRHAKRTLKRTHFNLCRIDLPAPWTKVSATERKTVGARRFVWKSGPSYLERASLSARLVESEADLLCVCVFQCLCCTLRAMGSWNEAHTQQVKRQSVGHLWWVGSIRNDWWVLWFNIEQNPNEKSSGWIWTKRKWQQSCSSLEVFVPVSWSIKTELCCPVCGSDPRYTQACPAWPEGSRWFISQQRIRNGFRSCIMQRFIWTNSNISSGRNFTLKRLLFHLSKSKGLFWVRVLASPDLRVHK